MLFGITNTMAQIPGFLTPVLVSEMTSQGTLDQWYMVFNVAALVLTVGGLTYLLCGSSELQHWAKNRKHFIQIYENETTSLNQSTP